MNSNNIPEIDRHIGIGTYCTEFGGVGGKIRKSIDEFVVSEKISEKALSSISLDSKGYAVFVLIKKSIDTYHALEKIQQTHKLRLRSLGLKDANALTQQYVCSSSKRTINQVPKSIIDRKYSLQLVGFLSGRPLVKKDMIGNGFKIKISDVKDNPELSEFDEHQFILNFYGYQRFGSTRPVSHLVGKAIIQRNFDKAVDLLLSYQSKHDSKEKKEIRESLGDKSNLHETLKKMPKSMDVERAIVKEITSQKTKNQIGAMRAIPLSLRRLFVQAYQSYLFNRTMTVAFDTGEDLFQAQQGDICFDVKENKLFKFEFGMDSHRAKIAVPLIGYAYMKNNRFHYCILKVLEEEGIQPKDFFVNELQEVSNEGGFRQAKIGCSDFETTKENSVSFILSRGSFATIVLREIMKPADPIVAGF